ncbi:uncharacterized protein LOC144445671 [Glandiceps talaboti]
MEKETLFSLEVVVEEVCVLSSTVPCRLPAVAFRMLDFPTLVIHHIEQEMAEKIKTKLTMDPSIDVPPQLHELKDRFGIFNINKGKSCLFKMDVETLRVHLKNTPLYVMLIDMWPNIPKLVGNSTIPLDSSMNSICLDIEDCGVNVPSVHGEKGRYKLFNLMSSEIGYITLGYRLLSLGPGLIQHIPDHAISKAGQKMENISPQVHKIQQAADIVLEDIETPMKKTAVVISKARDDIVKKPHAKPAMTQTETKSKKAKQVKFLPEEDSDIHVSDTVCPPPLFFNSMAEDLVYPTKPSSQPTAALTTSTPLWYQDEGSETDSIASDISGIGYIESHYKFAQTQTTPFSIRKTTRKPATPQKKLYPAYSTPRQPVRLTPRQTSQPALLPQNLPILNALLGELAQIQGMPLQVQMHEPVTPQRKPKTPINAVRTPSKGKENIKLPMKISPKQPPKTEKKHRTCAQATSRVPPSIGWLRQEPVYGKKKTKLSYGMTNTQRLRLQQNNPELLRQLELEEQEARQREEYGASDLDNSMNLRRLDGGEEGGPGFFGGTRTLGSEPPSSPRRKPVPTPRKSKGTISPDAVQQTNKRSVSKEPETRKLKGAPVERLNLNSLVSIAKEMESEQNGSCSTRSGKSIEVRIPPMPTEQDSDNSAYESEEEHKPTRNFPGFPDDHHQEKDYDSYDEDFEDSQASDEESEPYTSEESHRSKDSQPVTDVSEKSYRSDRSERSHHSQDASHHSPASQKSHMSSQGSHRSPASQGSHRSAASQGSHRSPASQGSHHSPASTHSQQYYYSSSGSGRSTDHSHSTGSEESESYEDDDDDNSDLGIGGYYPSVLEDVAPKPSAESPMQATKIITVKGASAFEPIGSTPRTQTEAERGDNPMYLSRESSEFKSVSISSIGVSDEAF